MENTPAAVTVVADIAGNNDSGMKLMVFHGFQKLTMLDYPGNTACTVFTAGCNFRCPFCHNATLVTDIDNKNVYTDDEILKYLEKRKGILDGICISGGEPLMHIEILDFIKKVKETGLLVKLDTNGSYPERLKELIDSGLIDYVAMDIKNSSAKYAETVSVPDFDFLPVRKSTDILLQGSVDYEFRTTLVKELHTLDDMTEIGKMISGAEKYFLQQFVDSGNLIGSGFSAFSMEEMTDFCQEVKKYVKSAELRGV